MKRLLLPLLAALALPISVNAYDVDKEMAAEFAKNFVRELEVFQEAGKRKDWDNFCLQGNMALNTLTAGWSYMQNAGMSYDDLSDSKRLIVEKMKSMPPRNKKCVVLY